MKILNSDRFSLPGTNGRFTHLATVQDGLHEFLCMYDLLEHKCYIEEVIGGQLCFIEDDNVAKDIADFLCEKNITNIKYGLPVSD